MEHEQKLYAAKTVPWPGATPYFGASMRQNPFGLRGSLPATACAPCTRTSSLSRVPSTGSSCPSRSTLLTCTTPSPTEENGPCLYLKPAEPVIAQVLGSLASTMSASSRTDNSSLNPPRRIP